MGKTLITTDGTTLLGGDDKAGVAEILCAAAEILKEGKPHGTVKIGFTPDEEIGEGADHFDVAGFGCDYAYTVDGGTLGSWSMRTLTLPLPPWRWRASPFTPAAPRTRWSTP